MVILSRRGRAGRVPSECRLGHGAHSAGTQAPKVDWQRKPEAQASPWTQSVKQLASRPILGSAAHRWPLAHGVVVQWSTHTPEVRPVMCSQSPPAQSEACAQMTVPEPVGGELVPLHSAGMHTPDTPAKFAPQTKPGAHVAPLEQSTRQLASNPTDEPVTHL